MSELNFTDTTGVLWGGRFEQTAETALFQLSKSTQFDWILAKYDLLASKAHALVLLEAGILSSIQYERIIAGITELEKLISVKEFSPIASDEDVHGALERGLIALVGEDLGGRLRAGRSRNDQIATLLRMWLKDNLIDIGLLVIEIITTLIQQAEANFGVIVAGKTHLQSAQPILLSHQLLAHAWPLQRDLGRLVECYHRLNVSPYGSGALVGSTLSLDPEKMAKLLGFPLCAANSIDATSARDFVAESAFVFTMIILDLSRFAEEIIIWASPEFNYVELSDKWATGSSIMPQKKNPDIPELLRGKTGRLIGNLTGLLATFKALPLAYNRDLQEDKEPIFDSTYQLKLLLPAFTGLIKTIKYNKEIMLSQAENGYTLATDVAEWLVKQGVPFKQAHIAAGKCVQIAEKQNKKINDLSISELKTVHPKFTVAVKEFLTVEKSIAARNTKGATAPSQIKTQIIQLKNEVQQYKNKLTTLSNVRLNAN